MQTPRLSIITAIHNGKAMNEIYWEALRRNTLSPFELILVDNHSTDGSEKYFQQAALAPQDPNGRLVYLRNEQNQSYPDSQIQGMAHARGDILVFLNNDTWMPPGWHRPFERELAENPWLVLSPSGQEAQPTQTLSRKLKARWRRVTALSRLWAWGTRASEKARLETSLRWMYGDLDRFQSPTPPWPSPYFHGIKGDCVVFHRQLLEKLPHPWDPRIEAADWHLYLTLANLHETNPEIPLPRVLLDTYVHHFGRYSARQRYEPFPLKAPFIPIDEFWGAAVVKRLWWGYQLPE